MQLLKVYLSSHDITYPVEPNLSGWTPSRGDAFVLRNTSWVLPWLWHHREVDEELVIAIVSFQGKNLSPSTADQI